VANDPNEQHGQAGSQVGSASNVPSAEYDAFLEDLQSIVAERVEEIRARQSAVTPKAFLDDEKTIREWPDVTGRIIEEYR